MTTHQIADATAPVARNRVTKAERRALRGTEDQVEFVVFEHFVPELQHFCGLEVHWTRAFEYLRARRERVQFVRWAEGRFTSYARWWHNNSTGLYHIGVGPDGRDVVLEEVEVEVCPECRAHNGSHHTTCSRRA